MNDLGQTISAIRKDTIDNPRLCQIFSCKVFKKAVCCADCAGNEKCISKCLNNPEICKMVTDKNNNISTKVRQGKYEYKEEGLK